MTGRPEAGCGFYSEGTGSGGKAWAPTWRLCPLLVADVRASPLWAGEPWKGGDKLAEVRGPSHTTRFFLLEACRGCGRDRVSPAQ